MTTTTKKKNKGITLIKKSNELIEARYKFDIWETRMFLSVLAQIHREDEAFKTYRIWYTEVIKTFGLRSNQSYELLRNAARELMKKTFKVSNQESGFNRETEYHIIRSVNYLAEGEEGKKGVENQEYVDITVDPEMRPLLLQLQKNFTAYDLRNVSRLGAYHLRIYELLKQYESIGERTLYVEEIKTMMELSSEYPHFGNFYQRIISPAVSDINASTDLFVIEVNKIREGRRYVALHFRFRTKTREEMDAIRGIMPQGSLFSPPSGGQRPAAAHSKDDLFKEFSDLVMGAWGVSPLTFAKLLEDHDEVRVRQAIRVTERALRQKKADSPAGFFVEAVRRGFTDEAEARLQATTKQQERAQALERLQEAYEAGLTRRIAELTSHDKGITGRAIDEVCGSPRYQTYLADKGIAAGDLDAFRKDEILRLAVMNAIVAGNLDQFQDLISAFEEEKQRIE